MIEIDSGKCNNCANCYDVCPAYVFGIRGRNGKKDVFVGHPGQCIACGHCMAACAPLAISHQRLSYEDFERLGEVDISPASMKNLLLSRRSVRKYREEPVPEDLIDDLIEVATHAGTGGNLQSVGFTVVKDKDLLSRLELASIDILWNNGFKFFDIRGLLPIVRLKFGAEMTDFLEANARTVKYRRENNELSGMVFRNAPAVILAHEIKQNTTGPVNCAVALRNIEMMAATMGLGTCWVGLLMAAADMKPKKINALLQLGSSRKVCGALMIGYPRHKSVMKIPRTNRGVNKL